MALNKRLSKYMTYDYFKSLGIFWAVMILLNIIAYLVTYRMQSEFVFGPMIRSGQMLSFAGANLFAVLIFFIVYAITMYYESFSLTGTFAITRRDFYLQAIVSNLIVAAISGVIQVGLLKLDILVIERLGYEPMLDYGYFHMNNSLLLNVLIVSFAFLLCLSLGNLVGILVYRYSYRFWIALAIVGFLTGLFAGNLASIVIGFFTSLGYLGGLIAI